MTLLRRLAERARNTEPGALRSLSIPFYGEPRKPVTAPEWVGVGREGDAPDVSNDSDQQTRAHAPPETRSPLQHSSGSERIPPNIANRGTLSPDEAQVLVPARALLPPQQELELDGEDEGTRKGRQQEEARVPRRAVLTQAPPEPSRIVAASKPRLPPARSDAAPVTSPLPARAPVARPNVEPEIHIHIGRIEVRAPASADTRTRAAEPRRPRITLDEYLARRGGA